MNQRARTIRATIGYEIRKDPNADVSDLRRELRKERLAEQIAAAAPDLTPEQRADLAALLAPTGAGAR